MRTYLIALLALLFAGCSEQAPTAKEASSATARAPAAAAAEAEPLPTIDTRSPDSVVKSYWAMQDWLARNQSALGMKLVVGDVYHAYMRSRLELGTGEFRAKSEEEQKALDEVFVDKKSPTSYQRDILKVESETETRAVVTAKILNVTPIPEGLELSEYVSDSRKYGRDIRYIVEKTSEGWRLSQAWHRDSADISLDKDSDGKPQTGGWTKAWEVTPKADTGPSEYHYSATEP